MRQCRASSRRLGAVAAYKGVGLSMFMNLLAGALPGGYHSKDVNIGKRGQFLLVIDPEIFGDANVFAEKPSTQWSNRSNQPIRSPMSPRSLPPERSSSEPTTSESHAGHVVYPSSTLQDLRNLSSQMGIPLEV